MAADLFAVVELSVEGIATQGPPGRQGGPLGGGQPPGGVRRVPVLDDEVDGHLALEAADVALAEVVAKLVHLSAHRIRILSKLSINILPVNPVLKSIIHIVYLTRKSPGRQLAIVITQSSHQKNYVDDRLNAKTCQKHV